MAKDRCRYHADTSAVGSCRQCAIPLCQACAVTRQEGIFCSQDCFDKFTRFQKSSEEYTEKVRRYRGRTNLKKWVFIAIAMAAAIFFLHMVYDVNSPADLPSALGEIWTDIIGLF